MPPRSDAIDEETPAVHVPGGLRREMQLVGSHALKLFVPADPDRLLDDPAVIEANARDDRMPYWAWSWHAADLLLTALPELLNHVPPGGTVCEIGCGLGRVALAAAVLRPDCCVLAHDHDETAIRLLATNAAANGLKLDASVADWSAPVPADLVLAADVLYERRFHAPLLDRFARDLATGVSICVADPGRHEAGRFLTDAMAAGLPVDADDWQQGTGGLIRFAAKPT